MSVMSDANVMTHLLDRLAEAGVEKLFGVPGDFTLAMLDDVEAHPSIEWVGCANELGAGYAADGYARLRGLGAVCTTFGVGELSAINAIAGAYAEHVPVIHIVGAPTTATQAAARATHHTLGDGDFHHFARMTAEVTHAQAELTAENAVDEIDRVIRETLAARRPGYLVIPADVAKAPVPESTHPPVEEAPLTAAGALEQLRDAVRVELATARSVALLAGILVQRMGAEPALHDVLALGIPHAVTLWGRRVVDESSPHYLGPYIGAVSTPETCAAIEDADVLIAVGVQFTDLMSGLLLATTAREDHRDHARIGAPRAPDVRADRDERRAGGAAGCPRRERCGRAKRAGWRHRRTRPSSPTRKLWAPPMAPLTRPVSGTPWPPTFRPATS